LFSLVDPALPALSTLSLHDALPIFAVWSPGFPVLSRRVVIVSPLGKRLAGAMAQLSEPAVVQDVLLSTQLVLATGPSLDTQSQRSEEHTSELQSRENLVCRLLLEKK